MTEPNPVQQLSPAAEDALFQRLLKRLADATQSAVDGAGSVVDAVSDAAGSAAAGVRDVATEATDQIATHAKDAVDFVQKYPIASVLGTIGPAGQIVLATITALAAKRVIESRRLGNEPVAQILFRVPESLRDEVKRLSIDSKRQMDELLTEGVLDLLVKYGRNLAALGHDQTTDQVPKGAIEFVPTPKPPKS